MHLKDVAVLNVGKGAMPSWSADGKWLALCKYGSERGVYIRSLDGVTERLIDREPGQIYVFDANRYEPPVRLEGQPADGMCWSPDGAPLIFLNSGSL